MAMDIVCNDGSGENVVDVRRRGRNGPMWEQVVREEVLRAALLNLLLSSSQRELGLLRPSLAFSPILFLLRILMGQCRLCGCAALAG